MKGVTERDETTGGISVSNITNYESFVQQREKFKKEARRLRKLRNPHIVDVHDLFEENSTVYYVMDFIDGENLAERMKRTGEPLSEKEVWDLLPQILDALKAVHAAGLWHLDLKPGNIMVDKDGNATLIDFGASKQMDVQTGGATAKTAVSFTNGYAPREQMEKNYSKMGPWTDIYSLGATLYALLTNKRPPLPSDLDDDDSPDKHVALPFSDEVSDMIRNLILWMMSTHRSKRPQSINELQEYLSLNSTTKDTAKDTETVENTQEENAVDEETSLHDEAKSDVSEKDDEETVFASEKVKSEPNENVAYNPYQEKPQPQQQPLYNNEEESSNTAWVWGLLATVVVTIIIVFGFKKCTEDENNEVVSQTDNTENVINSPTPSETNIVSSVTCTIGNLGTCTYSGEWDNKSDIPHGQGEAKFTDGRYYKGEFNHGQLNNVKGFFKYQNGDTFEGEFRNDRFYNGTYTVASDGSYFKGYFDENGQPKQGKWYDKNNNFQEQVG